MDWISVSILAGVAIVILVGRRLLNPILDRRAERKLSGDGTGPQGGPATDSSDPIGEAVTIARTPNIAGTRPTRPGRS